MALLNTLKTKGPKFTAAFIVILALAAIFSTAALASYTYKAALKNYLASAANEFYFTSDLLTDAETTPVYQVTHDWQTSDKAAISFELRNYDSPLNISSSKISYTAKAMPVGGSTVTAGGEISARGSGGNSKIVSLAIAKPAAHDPAEPLEVSVTAAAASPYTKTLRGKFVIAPVTPALCYQVAENAGSPVALLAIALAPATELSREIKLTWPEGAVLDMTNPLVIAAIDGEACDLAARTLTATLNTAAGYELVFFKDPEALQSEYTGVTLQELQ